jgi:glycerol uptake operon antiterminator
MPKIIAEVKECVGIPILAGGLIRNSEDVDAALMAGATAITTSKRELWEGFF